MINPESTIKNILLFAVITLSLIVNSCVKNGSDETNNTTNSSQLVLSGSLTDAFSSDDLISTHISELSSSISSAVSSQNELSEYESELISSYISISKSSVNVSSSVIQPTHTPTPIPTPELRYDEPILSRYKYETDNWNLMYHKNKCILGDFIYEIGLNKRYSPNHGGFTLYRFNKNDLTKREYVNRYENTDPDMSKYFSGYCGNFQYYNGKFYYNQVDIDDYSVSLCEISIDGKEFRFISKYPGEIVEIDGVPWVYFVGANHRFSDEITITEKTVGRYPLYSAADFSKYETTQFTDRIPMSRSLYFANGWLYYTGLRFKYDFSVYQKVGYAASIWVDNWLYYFDYTYDRIIKCRPDGSDEQIIYSFNSGELLYGNMFIGYFEVYFYSNGYIYFAFKDNLYRVKTQRDSNIEIFSEPLPVHVGVYFDKICYDNLWYSLIDKTKTKFTNYPKGY